MPTFRVKDPISGKIIKLTGDSPPTEQEIEQIISQTVGQAEVQKKTTGFLPKEAEVEKLISERVDPVETLKKEVQTPFDFKKRLLPSLAKPFVTGTKVLAIPAARAFSAAGGLGLGLQEQKGFKESFKMAGEGLTGKKQFRLFDPLRKTGVVPPIVSTGLELFTEIAVSLKLFSSANKALRGPIEKFSDAKLLKVGKQLVRGSDDAVKVVGKRLNKVYQPINKVNVDASKILDDVAELPQPIIKHIERTVGNVDDFLQDFNIEKARKLKGTIGELRSTGFGKADLGKVEFVLDKQVNKTYGIIKQSMQEGLNKVKLGKEAKRLLEADDIFFNTKNASNFIKKTVTDPTLRAPTKIGRAASGLEKTADISFRRAANILKKAGLKSKIDINKAVNALESFNQLQKIQRFQGFVGRSLLRGAVIGGVGGRILREGQ